MNNQLPIINHQIITNHRYFNNQTNKHLVIRLLVMGIYLVIGIWLLGIPCFAQDKEKLLNLSKQVMEAKDNDDIDLLLGELTGLYFKESKFNECVDFLSSLVKQKKELAPAANYYIALSRYHQLKMLQEKQNWEEYFSKGDVYREELAVSAQKAIASSDNKNIFKIYSRLLLWQFHEDAEDSFIEQARVDLLTSTKDYALEAKSSQPIKLVADKLFSYDKKAEAKELYRLYVDKLVASGIKDEELKAAALNFYRENNLELSENLYDIYLERLARSEPKEGFVAALLEVAKQFSYKEEGLNDPLYAEKIFQKLEELGTAVVFNEELSYLRAFNLEKAKDYTKAGSIYRNLTERFPQGLHFDESLFKTGIITTYVQRDLKTGRGYFEKLITKENTSPEVISSWYQLGLLAQWQGDFLKAKEYYNKLLEKAKDNYPETVTLVKERIKEIEGGQAIEYNLKTFLDASLKEENVQFDMTKVDLRSQPAKAKVGQSVGLKASVYLGESGCMQPEVQYLWSGDIGVANPQANEPTINTSYLHNGTKVINLVVVSPSGIVDRNLDLLTIN